MPIPTEQDILAACEAFMRDADMASTPFGVGAIGDLHLIKTLREGRQIHLSTAQKILDFIDDQRAKLGLKPRRGAPKRRK